MSGERFFLDTAYFQALAVQRDHHHRSALSLQNRLRSAAEIWTTEAVLIEVANALSVTNRRDAIAVIEQCYRTPVVRVIPVTTALLFQALDLYRSRPDKEWGLTDCISFVVMNTNGLADALTSDRHFRQAGFRALLLEEP